MSKYVDFAQVRKGQDGSTYIKIIADVTLSPDSKVYKDTPQSKIDFFVEKGFITEEEGESRKEKIPEYILQVLTAKV